MLDGFAERWKGTTPATSAHVEASTLALGSAVDEPALESVLQLYGDTPAAPLAATRLKELQWQALRRAPSSDGISAFLKRWPAAASGENRPYAICEKLATEARLEGSVRAWCADLGLAAALANPTASGLARFADQWSETPAAQAATERLRALEWVTVSAAPTPEALEAFAARWPGSAEAAAATAGLADARLSAALSVARTAAGLPDPRDEAALAAAGYVCPAAGGACTGRFQPALTLSPTSVVWAGFPSAGALAWIAAAGAPVAGRFDDPANWSASWGTAAQTVTLGVSELAVRMEVSAAVAPPASPAPAALLSHLSDLRTPVATWSAPLPSGAPKAWRRFSTVGGRSFQVATSGTKSWLRLSDPLLRATRVWSFAHTVDRGVSGPLPAELFATTTDGLGVVALEGCRVVPLECDGDSVVEPTACKAAIAPAAGGPLVRPAGLGPAVGVNADGRVGDAFSLGAVNGYCYDIVANATWKDVRLGAAGWSAAKSANQTYVGASSQTSDGDIPPALAYVPGDDVWCGDVTVFNPGALSVRKGGQVLSRRAIGAELHGNFYLLQEASSDCDVTSALIDQRTWKRIALDLLPPTPAGSPLPSALGGAPLDAVRVGSEVHLLAADGVTWHIVRLP